MYARHRRPARHWVRRHLRDLFHLLACFATLLLCLTAEGWANWLLSL